MLVTGGSGGIGKETAKILLSKNAKVYIAARNATTGAEAVQELAKLTGKTPVFLKVDLVDLKSVKAAAEEFQSKEPKLDVLFNNGGVMFPPWEKTTVDGYDLQFGTNVLGHFYLTKLLPQLTAAAQSSPDGKARVINTSSMGHMVFNPSLDFDTFKDGPARKKLDEKKLYGQSKFGNVVFSNELARRYVNQGIVSISLHPGNIKTDLSRHSSPAERALANWMLYPVSLGVLTQLYAGTTPEALKLSGKYMIPWARVGKAHKATDDPEQAVKLWDWLEEQVKGL
ncbi:NAD-P-binding protein [Mycena maculata]|uniref:NAD-P-binding protein n=1 Tax=Mycena maculata TaxID=230809 RepID=A0AAD7IX29_9AGAR|nr:NAD-P-binding protein [Mycena maculata]